MSRAALLCLLLLAACSGGSRGSDDPQHRACEAAANDDPAVREEMRKRAGSEGYLWQHNDQYLALRQQAVLRCLRARGLAPPGGVEAPRTN
jgi:hypothetical protein